MGWTKGLAACGAVAVLTMAGGPARAAGSCVGTLSGNLINPLPVPTVLSVQLADQSAQNETLGARFGQGLRDAGATVTADGRVNVQLAATVTGNVAPGAAASVLTNEFGFAGRIATGGPPPTLVMSVSLLDSTQAEIDWIGYVTCTIKTNDLGQLAQDLGFAIGQAVGKTFDRRPL